MKFLPIHTEALRYFGYTEEESRFLYLVATHSGYFTCQQFLRFIKMKPGKRSVAFARKVVEKGHASSKEYLRHGRVFHLFSRNLYEAIGRENVRFRRVHSTEYIRTRLVDPDLAGKGRWFGSASYEALRVTLVGNSEHFLTLPQDVFGLTIVNHRWRQQAHAGVAVLFVVPTKKSLTESTAVLDAPKAVRELRPILQGTELTLGIRIVVRDVRPAMRLGDA